MAINFALVLAKKSCIESLRVKLFNCHQPSSIRQRLVTAH
ncbi:MAG: hypothetical protein OFPI_34850 [Osedax symbiont Rs2]|nr:MAG: hypothetical protein OFPI_34850 [Osedax symbiont Rs2]